MFIRIFLNEKEGRALARLLQVLTFKNLGKDGLNLIDDEIQVWARSAMLAIRAELGGKGIMP